LIFTLIDPTQNRLMSFVELDAHWGDDVMTIDPVTEHQLEMGIDIARAGSVGIKILYEGLPDTRRT
jgi:hypothetical protein